MNRDELAFVDLKFHLAAALRLAARLKLGRVFSALARVDRDLREDVLDPLPWHRPRPR